MAKISIITSGHFSTNPRVWREADALAEAGYDVSVIGVCYDDGQAAMDEDMLRSRPWRMVKAADLRAQTAAAKAFRTWHRLRRRLGMMLIRHGVDDPHCLGYAIDRLLKSARREKADLNIVHLEPALWVGRHLAAEGCVIGVDIEDWYSEDSPGAPADHRRRSYLRSLEYSVLKLARHATTTSHAMAQALGDTFKVAPPNVIYNSTRRVAYCPPGLTDVLQLLWFSQTLGPGRGLEDLFAALGSTNGEWELSLLCNSSAEMVDWVRTQVSDSVFDRIHFVPFLPPDQLNEFVAMHDVGLALEVHSCRNKNLTASNKIFGYLQGGLTVIATVTSGQTEILNLVPEAAHIYQSGDSATLSSILDGLIADRHGVRARRESIHQQSNDRLGYEQCVPVLLESVERALMPRVKVCV